MNATPITRIYVAACRGDFHLTRLCVASIRYWYPDIPITLIPDYELGEFDSTLLERGWNVERFETNVRRFGWCLSKLEALFPPRRERYLMLDSDIVLLGPVLDVLNETPGDFVVQPEERSGFELERDTFVVEPLKAFDPAFVVPRFVFNCGQYVGTSGLLRREDFGSVMEWSSPRRALHPEIFKCGDQGLFNYVLSKAETAGRLTIGFRKFYLWRRDDSSAISVNRIAARNSDPLLMHWAGAKPDSAEKMERADILAFYAAFERRHLSLKSRLTYWFRGQTAAKWRKHLRRGRWLIRQWWAGSPYAAGGSAADFKFVQLRNFFDLEQANGTSWRWTEPEASIELMIPRGRYRVKIETGSPFPMAQLPHLNLHLFINGKLVPAVITEGIAEFDLDPDSLNPRAPQILSWKMDRMAAGGEDERAFGMPISALWVFRRGRF
jgi:hypothetical protein